MSPHSPPTDQCSESFDYIIIGGGTGGSVAASYFEKNGVDFVWLEAGSDESSRLIQYLANDPQSKPRMNWAPTNLETTTGRQIPYQIPKSMGGMSAHYKGNQYWTMEDTISSLEIAESEMEALDFVRNVTNKQVYCDDFDSRYHTHPRSKDSPAPTSNISSLPMCMYGTCKGDSPCRLNTLYAADMGLVSPTEQGEWYRQSSYLEYWKPSERTPPVRTDSEAIALKFEGKRVVGAYVKTQSSSQLICARKSVILAAGVMGNSRILPLKSYAFFAQPVVLYIDEKLVGSVEQCDANSISGGTLHKYDDSGFLSTLAICKVHGKNRIIFATPLAVNSKVKGIITKTSNTDVKAQLNLDDSEILEDLKRDFRETVSSLFDIEVNITTGFEYAAYHWTGDANITRHSRLRGYDNLFLGDAMAVVGTTHGWTSFNARVAGALAALRSLRLSSSFCPTIKTWYNQGECCSAKSESYCNNLEDEYMSRTCCK